MSKKTLPKKVEANHKMLLTDLRTLIEESRRAVTVTVNAGLTMLYWHIGKRIQEEILKNERAEYGKEIVATLSRQLTQDYGKGFGHSALTRMVKFSEIFPDKQIVATLWQQLSWSHFRELLPLEEPLQREFYAEMCRVERWSVRTLRKQIDAMLYERTALSRKPEQLIQEELSNLREGEQSSPALILKDPYILDFLELDDRYIEKNLEDAILLSAIQSLKDIVFDGLIRTNEKIYDLLCLGRSMQQTIDGDTKSCPLNYIDWNPQTWLTNNVFHVTEEFYLERAGSHDPRKPDIVLFVNGIP